MKKFWIVFCAVFLLFGCTSKAPKKSEAQGSDLLEEAMQEEAKEPEDVIYDAWQKTRTVKSYDVSYSWEATPANEFYKYTKTTFEGTVSDAENGVLEGYYYNEMLVNDNVDPSTKRGDLITEGPITQKAGENAILPVEYNGGYEYSPGNMNIFLVTPHLFLGISDQGEGLLEYSLQEEEIENGTRYMLHAVENKKYDDGKPEFQQTADCIYEVNKEGYLVFYKQTSVAPFFTLDNQLADRNHMIVEQCTFSNLK
ncbi:hypothetical protein [Massilicoli timonensis]|uniref:hypothetical protein n=1 Tax=Massilicoli timonensis TaxID=2015901 RepID=UPI0023F4A771|nr:hypothetical protein [Massilicoli timonensis]